MDAQTNAIERPAATWRQLTEELRVQRKRPFTEWGPLLHDIYAAASTDAGAQAAMTITEGMLTFDAYGAFIREAGIKIEKHGQFRSLAAALESMIANVRMWRREKAEAETPSRRKEKFDAVANAARSLVDALKKLDKWHLWSMKHGAASVRRMHEDCGLIKAHVVQLRGFGIGGPVSADQIYAYLTDPYAIEALRQAAMLAPQHNFPILDADVLAVRELAKIADLPLIRKEPLIGLVQYFFLQTDRMDDISAVEMTKSQADHLIRRSMESERG